MVFNRLDFETTTRIEGEKKIVDMKLKKVVFQPVSYQVKMKADGIDIGTVAAGKMIFSKELDIEIDKDLPADAALEGEVKSWGLLGIFLPTDEGTFEG